MPINWTSLIHQIEPKARTTAPATDARIIKVEQAIGVTFPQDLRALLLQTDGILDDGYGPILPLTLDHPAPFTNAAGLTFPAATFPAHPYSIEQYTLLQRSLWEQDAGVNHDTYVVIGGDIGGNPFGFFPGDPQTTLIQLISHDDGSIEPTTFTLEEYLRHYFRECRWFNDEA